jgi:hypothetical protein
LHVGKSFGIKLKDEKTQKKKSHNILQYINSTFTAAHSWVAVCIDFERYTKMNNLDI